MSVKFKKITEYRFGFSRCVMIGLCVLAISQPNPARSQNIFDTGSGNWNSPELWSTGIIPVSGEAVEIGGITARVATVSTNDAVSKYAYIGADSGESGTVNVTGAGSLWQNSIDMFVGDSGTGNLNILDGGKVTNQTAYVGLNPEGEGTVSVSGSGSLWQGSAGMFVGYSGNGTLNVLNGGKVSNGTAYVGSDSEHTGTVSVIGTNSLWEINGQLLTIGYSGVGTLNIEAGGKVSSNRSIIGNGQVTVTGTNSLWTSLDDMDIGREEAGILTVANGGKVSAAVLRLALNSESQGILNLNGIAGLRGVLETHGITENHGSGTIVFKGGILRANASSIYFISGFETGDVILEAGGGTIDSNGFNITVTPGLVGTGGLSKEGAGTLILAGASTYTGSTYVRNGILEVIGGASINNKPGNTIVGQLAGENGTLQIDTGATVTDAQGILGSSVGSQGTAQVSGTWTHSDKLRVGNEGGGTLSIENGGLVNTSTVELGTYASGNGFLTVNGVAGNRGVLRTASISEKAGTGKLTINGGVLRASDDNTGFIKDFEAGDVTLGSGGGTIDSNGHNITAASALGGTGSLSKEGIGTLKLSAANTYKGGTFVKNGTLELVSGGSLSHGSKSLIVGQSTGESGSLVIGAGATVKDSQGILGSAIGSTGSASVSGTWTNTDKIRVGNEGTGTLTIENGGLVSSTTVELGTYATGTGSLTVNGVSGNRGVLQTGSIAERDGNGTLTLDGGVLWANADNTGFIKNFEAGEVTLGAGGGIIDSNGHNITVVSGLGGTGSLTKEGTGTLNLTGKNTYTGGTTVKAGTLNVDGGMFSMDHTFAIHHSDAQMTVGDTAGDNGTLVIGNGSWVFNGQGVVGNSADSTGMVTVTGTDTFWRNAGNLSIGREGNGTLLIEAGGLVVTAGNVIASDSFIGENASGVGSVTVTGANSTWRNEGGDLYVGFRGKGSLNIEDGGQVSATYGYVGGFAGSSGAAKISGANSLLKLLSDFGVGYEANATLDVDSGGKVSNMWGRVASMSGSTAVVTVTGPGSSWANSAYLHVGTEGNGTLIVADGGKVIAPSVYLGTSDGGQGNINLNGISGSRGVLETAGISEGRGSGRVTFDGGILRATASSADFISGFEAGDITLASGGGTIDSNGFNVSVLSPLGGTGSLAKEGLGNLKLAGINTYTGGTFVRNGTLELVSGSSISHGSQTMYIGQAAGENGKLIVGAGASVTDAQGVLGSNVGSMGTASIDGTWTNTGKIRVGNEGTGALTIQNGGLVSASTVELGTYATGTGSLVIKGVSGKRGVLLTGSIAERDGNGTLAINGGVLKASADNTGFVKNFEAGEVTLGNGGGFIDSNGHSIAITSSMSGTGALIKQGEGTLKLSGANTHTGGTALTAGTLLVANSAALGNGDVALTSGTLGTDGVQHQINVADDLIWNTGALISLTVTPDSSSEKIAVEGSLSKVGAGQLIFSLTPSGLLPGHTNFLVMTVAEGFGSLSASSFGYVTVDSGFDGTFRINGTELWFDDDFIPTVTLGSSRSSTDVTAVPEPSTWMLIGLGLGMVVWVGLKRNRRQA